MLRTVLKYAALPVLVIATILGLFAYVHGNPATRPAGSTMETSPPAQENSPARLAPPVTPDTSAVSLQVEDFAPDKGLVGTFTLSARLKGMPSGTAAGFVYQLSDGSFAMNYFEPLGPEIDDTFMYYAVEGGSHVRFVVATPEAFKQISRSSNADGEVRLGQADSLKAAGLALIPMQDNLFIPDSIH